VNRRGWRARRSRWKKSVHEMTTRNEQIKVRMASYNIASRRHSFNDDDDEYSSVGYNTRLSNRL